MQWRESAPFYAQTRGMGRKKAPFRFVLALWTIVALREEILIDYPFNKWYNMANGWPGCLK